MKPLIGIIFGNSIFSFTWINESLVLLILIMEVSDLAELSSFPWIFLQLKDLFILNHILLHLILYEAF
jgi:hypothetical protein